MSIDIADFVLAVAAAFVVGCLIASFLNVVIWRVPNGISLVDPPRSFCPTCKERIAWYDNIPLVSYAVLGGRCRHCHEPISARYPLVEALGGASAAMVVAGAMGGLYPGWLLPDLLYLTAVSIVVAFIDLDHQLILNVVVYPSYLVSLVLLSLASGMAGSWWSLGRAAAGGLALGVFYLLLALIWPGGMGMGDVKLAALLGMSLAWMGWGPLLVGGFVAFLVGGVVGVVQMACHKVDIHGGIPFGPSMVVGAWIGIMAGAPLARLYLGLMGLG